MGTLGIELINLMEEHWYMLTVRLLIQPSPSNRHALPRPYAKRENRPLCYRFP